MSRLRRFEYIAWGLGFALIAIYGAVRVHGTVMKQHELERFAEARQAAAESRPANGGAIPVAASGDELAVDFGLWSEGRVRAYRESLERQTESPLAVLRIPKIRLEVPVLDGTDDPADGLPIAAPPPALPEGPHLGYAVQWFLFAGVVVVGYPLLLRRVTRRG